MGTVIKLKNQINNSYFQLKESVEDKLVLTEEKIKLKLNSEVELVKKMTDYHIKTGGKRLRALLTLEPPKVRLTPSGVSIPSRSEPFITAKDATSSA